MKVMLQSSMVVAMSVYGIAALLAALACTLLPIETKGKELKETVVFNKWSTPKTSDYLFIYVTLSH